MTQHTENTTHSGLRIERSQTSKHGRAALIGGLALLTVLTLGASEAWAQGARRGNGQGRGAVFAPRVAQALRLTQAQQTRIRGLQIRIRQATADERAQLREVQAQIRQARLAPQNTMHMLQPLYSQAQVLRSSIYAQQLQFRTAVYRVLNPRQRARLNAIIQQRRAINRARQSQAQRPGRNLPTHHSLSNHGN